MIIYLINIALILFWRVFFSESRFKNGRKLFCGAAAIQWILVSGLRAWDVGADTENYANIFEQIERQSWGSIFVNFAQSIRNGEIDEVGYKLIMKIFQIFSSEYQLFLIAIAVLLVVLMTRWIYKYSASPCTSFILFSTLFYSFYGVTGHRQTIATALIVFYGYDLIRDRKFWKFMLVAIVSFLIHKSSIVFVPLYFLTMLPVTPLYKWLCALGIGLVALFGVPLYRTFALWLGYSEHQINYAEGGAELYAILLITLCIITWIFHPRIKRNRMDADHLFHAISMALLTALFVLQNQGFMRVQQYYSLFIMITIPELINLVKREYRLPVYLAFGAVMVAYLIIQNPYYAFFWMG